MILTVIGILAVAAFIATICSALNKAPIWVAVLLLCVIELLRIMPKGN